MTLKNYLYLLTFSFGISLGQAQQNGEQVLFQMRAALHHPGHPTANLFYPDKAGIPTKLELEPSDLSSSIITQLTNGLLVLYDKTTVDPKDPEASIAASCKIPPGAKQWIIVILPSPPNAKPAYRMVFIDDSAKVFPKGESRVLTLVPMEAAVEAGEHKIPVHPGEIARLPPVKKVNEYNLAQTNFYYKKGEAWTVLTERQLQYLDGYRRIFIVHSTPKASEPSIRTILDNTTP